MNTTRGSLKKMKIYSVKVSRSDIFLGTMFIGVIIGLVYTGTVPSLYRKDVKQHIDLFR